MNDPELIRAYIPLVSYLGSVMGSNVEVVLHNCESPNKSVIAIANGHLSGRKVGSPITDFAMSFIMNGQYKEHDFISNYRAKANGKVFSSSTFFIKDAVGNLIGMLCINKDLSTAKNCLNTLSSFLDSINMGIALNTGSAETIQENLDMPIDSLASSIVQKTVSSYNISPERLTREEKRKIVQELDEQGISKIKGGVSEIARLLEVSESTVYRYINQKDSDL